MREIAEAGVGTLVFSWWGFDSPENDRLPTVEQAAEKQGLDIAIHVEPYRGRTPAQAAEDIARLHEEHGVTDFYVYDADRDPASDWAEALEPLDGVRVFGHTTLVGRAKASGFDGLYTYDVVTWTGALFRRLCTQAHAAGLLCAPSVGPGYDARLATRLDSVRPRNDGLTYDRMWKTVLKANPDLVTVTSYNEWQEGTQIEPARVAVGKPSYEGAWGKSGISRAARVPLRDGTLGGAPARTRASVERGREPTAVRHRHGIVLAQVVEDRERELAQPVAALGRRAGDLREEEIERSLGIVHFEGCKDVGQLAVRAQAVDDPVRLRRGEELVEKRRDGDRRPRTDELGDDPPVLECLHGGNPLDPEHRREPGVRVDVDLRQLDRARTGCDLGLQDRRERPTRAAPRGPEVDDDRALVRALDHVALECRLRDVHATSNVRGGGAHSRTTTSAPQPASRAAETCSGSTPRNDG